jgi:hypothetical protein
MGKYNKPEKKSKPPNHKRVCRKCGWVLYGWEHCGQRTARLNMDKTFASEVEGVASIEKLSEGKP